jgi:hypothetical protein
MEWARLRLSTSGQTRAPRVDERSEPPYGAVNGGRCATEEAASLFDQRGNRGHG